jgi:hypothetical protein
MSGSMLGRTARAALPLVEIRNSSSRLGPNSAVSVVARRAGACVSNILLQGGLLG